MQEKISRLQEIISASDNIVFFGGAGVSTDSGIPDFRSQDGIYNQSYQYPPETILSHGFYMNHKSEFYEFYRDKMLCIDAKPNITHYKLAELEHMGKLKAIITQNIDGLHELAGSKNVIGLHGSVVRNYCERCNTKYPVQYILSSTGIPKCKCGGDIKPDVVLYGEGLDDDIVKNAIHYITQADVLIVGGTSLVVYPAAGLIDYFRGSGLVVINKSETHKDEKADLLINENISEVMAQI